MRGKPRYAKDSPKIYRRPTPDLCIEFCERHGIEPREHALAYDQFFPKWLYDAGVEEVKRELERRYREISERYADKIRTIEVTNEMSWAKGKTSFYDEPDFVEWCFKLAEKHFPNNQLVINEENNEKKVGTTIKVLCEGFDPVGETYYGRSEADAPDIDGKIYFTGRKGILPGTFVDVLIDEVVEYDLCGTAVNVY